jgi:hypothetical protein
MGLTLMESSYKNRPDRNTVRIRRAGGLSPG